MQKKRLRNLKRNINEIGKMQQDKNIRKEHLEEENYQGDLRQENCSDGQTKGTIKNIGEDWKGIGDSGRVNDQGRGK